ncbi:hypothetical protein ACIPL1_21715 [Pseudomonas sp. NPDC090202]|uniref:hypothetical protein n=1 Tax=unclassified Pseudomonas TaxID=196821 RepID=UPI0037FC2A5F
MLRSTLAIVAASVSFGCVAELRVSSTSQVCGLLRDTQLRAGEWAPGSDGREGCASEARSVSANAAGSTIAYTAEGTDGIPQRLKLTVQVASAADDDAAKRELVKATKRLAVRALGMSVPHVVDESIMKARPARVDVGSGHVTLTRTPATGQRYELTVSVE